MKLPIVFTILCLLTAFTALFYAIRARCKYENRKKKEIGSYNHRAKTSVAENAAKAGAGIELTGNHVSNSEIDYGIRELVKFALDIKPDYIVGINRGGVLVGAHISFAIRLSSENFKKCVVINKNGESYVDTSDLSDLQGVVMIVDSIVRTGISMSSVTKELTNNFRKIEYLYKTALISSVDINYNKVFKNLDSCPCVTKNSAIFLPWNHKNDYTNSFSKEARSKQIIGNDRKVQEYSLVEKKSRNDIVRELSDVLG